ncbi:ABC-ATPase domain-containing protein [Alkalilimnicola sp. S0819]|uniref:ABC-ATPase domain-containing protein n=1 Tax=Alkalilimnicola sp. S0819 TaxID=2613922 RepID=UPI0012622980|nr:ABC-ATPase domain-containing protein [Alkalilimnicola sp. S0819]KAB7624099.1 isopentenyl-diphosphate delta-isomerase [Alkalilimnicola sp. S0819]MPQ16350.1 isopentenyl-diphosphate delta-isomerase [Alkalilimnicola sp. S0819]
MKALERQLAALHGRGYKAYKSLTGEYAYPRCRLYIDHVQADPYAAPSRLRALVPWEQARLPDSARRGGARERAARDFIARRFRQAARDCRELAMDAGHQTVLDRTAVLFRPEGVELRYTVELPGRGRSIDGQRARQVLCEVLPEVIRQCAEADALDLDALEAHCAAVEDQTALRAQLAERGLVAFVGDGAVLPRRSGVDDRPLKDAIAFQSPESRRITLHTPNAGPLTGMAIPRGITLIVGGGFHGKSTLLNALEQGVYDHLPGDGREQVVTDPGAVKLRAEDGRAVQQVDLSPFINHLPYGKSTRAFVTELASGSTSQAAALQEALELGASALLVDEDTSATNFMIRDQRMQALVAKAQEPITPFVDRIAELRDRLGVSTLLVMGGSGDYFDCADQVIQMQDYLPLDVTDEARAVAARHHTGRRAEAESPLQRPARRALLADSLDPCTRPGKRRIKVRGLDTLVFGREDIDLRAVEQLVDPSQLRAIGLLLARLAERGGTLADPVAAIEALLAEDLTTLPDRPDGDLARPRAAEVMAALNRLRGARFAAGVTETGA